MANYAILIVAALFLLIRAFVPALLKGRENAELERVRAVLRQRIMRDPRNGAAYHELARSYSKQNKLREAAQVYEQLLPYVAEIERFEVNKNLQDLYRDIRIEQETKFKGFGVDAPKLSHATFCPSCGSSNPKNATRCWECGGMLVSKDNPVDRLHEYWQDRNFRRTVTDSVVGIVVVVGLLRVCYDAPMELKLVAIFLAFVVISWQVWLKVPHR